MKTPRTCVEKEQVFAYVHHMLHEGEAGRVEAHLASCAECHKVADGFQRLDSVLGDWKPAEPSPWFDARARARIAAEARSRRFFARLSWRAWSGMAAVAVLAIVASIVVLRPPRRAHSVPMTETAALTAVVRSSATPTTSHRPAAENAEAGGKNVQAGGATTVAQSQPATQEIDLYKNLNVLENYDMLANFDVLSELPQAGSSTSD